MKIRKIVLALSVAGSVVSSSAASVLHAVNFCATNAENISVGVRADHDNFNLNTSVIADMIGYDIKYYDYPGEECSKENLVKVLSELQPGADDIVMFYYSGHGGRNVDDKSEFPQMCLKYNIYQEDKFVPVHYVQDQLRGKNGRLKVILADCCNKEDGSISSKGVIVQMKGATKVDNDEYANISKLFLTEKGMLTMSGSKAGEPSFGPDDGGLFSNAFWVVIDGVAKGAVAPVWSDVTSSATALTSQCSGGRQNPKSDLSELALNAPTSSNNNAGVAVAPPAAPTVDPANSTNSWMSNAFKLLLHENDSDWRLDMAQTMESHCTPGAMVQVVGRNMTTIVDTLSATAYIRSLCLSPFVRQVIVIEERTDSAGKVSYLKVHEIRN